MGYTCNYCGCSPCGCNSQQEELGLPQTQANTTNIIGIPGPTIFEYEKEIGKIPEDMTYDEWKNLPVNSTYSIIEYGDNA